MTDHKGLPVAGYLPQTDDKVALVNANKALEELCVRMAERLEAADLGEGKRVDPRMIAIYRTGVTQSFMWLNRAVFQPGRVSDAEITRAAADVLSLLPVMQGYDGL